jgi:hypothetical protein
MEKEQIFDKNTLLVYLINELISPTKNYKVKTVLTSEGCWTGKIIIEETTQDAEKDIDEYYICLGNQTKRGREE